MSIQDTHTVYHNFAINASAGEVYDAVSNPSHLVNWWPSKCSGSPALGNEYNFYFTEEYDWYGKVVKSEPGKAFHIKMTKSDKDWDPTTFGFDLKSDDNKVAVSFWHSGWLECNEHFKISSFCWAMLLNGLKKYVEDGHIIPFAERS